MPEPEPFLVFTRPLNALGLRYMVTGSVAAIYYGEPRMTNDVDIVILIHTDRIHDFIQHFPLAEFYCPPLEVLRIESSRYRRGHFNLIHHQTGFKADIYPVQDDPLHLWGLDRRQEVDMDGEPIYMAPPEYVILRKLQFYREGQSAKHLSDIRGMLESLGKDWDRSELMKMMDEFNLMDEWVSVGMDQNPPSSKEI